MKKLIIVGSPLAGKSTLHNYLNKKLAGFCYELDQEICKENKGDWVEDEQHRNHVLVPKIIKKITSKNEYILFTSYIDLNFLKNLTKCKSIRVLQLHVSKEGLQKRNQQRVEKGQSLCAKKDLSKNLPYQEDLLASGMVFKQLNGEKPIEKLAEEILSYIHHG